VIEKTVPAAGVITYQGQPLEDYMVTFYPKDGKRPAAGKTDAEGRFTLGTNGPGDGAVAGIHAIAVNYAGPEMHEEPGKEEFKPLPPPKVAIPEKYANHQTSDLTQEIPAAGSKSMKIELK
jgi:hypothetical protein